MFSRSILDYVSHNPEELIMPKSVLGVLTNIRFSLSYVGKLDLAE